LHDEKKYGSKVKNAVVKALGNYADYDLRPSGIGEILLPIRSARNLPKKELQKLVDPDIRAESEIRTAAMLNKALLKKYNSWQEGEFFHTCCCEPYRFFVDKKEAVNNIGEIHWWIPAFDPSLNASICPLQIPAPIGNLHEHSLDELYRRASANKDFKTLAEQGPQGLARKHSLWPEKEIKERFMERTPCGLCEDVYAQLNK
jgi:hypothetical protein